MKPSFLPSPLVLNRSNPGFRPLRRAFSLIELLVVVAILGVLAALLFPALGAMRTRAATGVTISNLRQLQKANLLYAAEHEGRFVAPQVNGDWANGMWFQNEDFLAYLGTSNTGRMWDEDWPEVAKSGHRSASPNQPPGKMDRQASIGINIGMRQHWANNDGTYNDLSFRQAAIRQPSKAMAFADANDTWIRMDRATAWKGDRAGWFGMSIAYRNRGRAAVVFFDGHVAMLRPEEVANNWTLWIPDAAD